MGKDNKGRELGKGLYQWKDGRYEARAKVNGKNIDIFGRNLRELKKRFEEEKELAVNRLEARINRLTLSEWFDEWFENYKVPYVWYKEMFYIIFLTGMRIGEVGSLMWSDIDFDNKCIHINRSLSCQYEYGKKMLRLTEPKTHNSYRKIPFFEEAEEMYLSQQKKVKELKKTLGSRWRGEEGEGAGFGLMM